MKLILLFITMVGSTPVEMTRPDLEKTYTSVTECTDAGRLRLANIQGSKSVDLTKADAAQGRHEIFVCFDDPNVGL